MAFICPSDPIVGQNQNDQTSSVRRNKANISIDMGIIASITNDVIGDERLRPFLWNRTLEMAYILVERGLPFLPRDCQGRLPVVWVKYDI